MQVHMPLVRALRNEGLRERHWQQLQQRTGLAILGVSSATPNPNPTLKP